MTVAEVTSRIAQIQTQLAALAPTGAAGSASTFAAALQTYATDDTSTDPTALPGAVTTSSAGGDAVVAEASKYLGLPYVWGGSDPSDGGMDCSGLVQYVYQKFGVDLPRLSADQARSGTAVASMAQAQPGDLLAWDSSSRNVGADHIAIYVGNGKMIEAPRTGLDIRLVDVPSTPDYIRRVLPSAPDVAAVRSAAPSTTGLRDVPFASLFTEAAAKYGVDARLLAAVAQQESGYNARAVSPAGAQGLMQLMPGTARSLGVTDSFDPAQSVDGAARLLDQLLERFDGRLDLALAGYNAGPGAVERYHGIPPYPETRNYVRSILAHLQGAA